tara:strand:- start:15639 stop:16058 length:420 start_codon:yes stop_codon:yes gene_type:complete
MDYIRLKDGISFSVMEAKGFTWKMWDDAERKMLTSNTWKPGYAKRYFLITDHGGLEVSQAQLGQMLTGAYKEGKCDINGKTFGVKTNGKEGKEVRYFINLVHKISLEEAKGACMSHDTEERIDKAIAEKEEVEIDDLPF